jgi:hypothetical protein
MTTTIEEQTIQAVVKEKTPFVVGDLFCYCEKCLK